MHFAYVTVLNCNSQLHPIQNNFILKAKLTIVLSKSLVLLFYFP